MRLIAWALVVCVVVVLGATAVGRAVDAQIQNRVILTRDGVIQDCEITPTGGEFAYGNCHRIP